MTAASILAKISGVSAMMGVERDAACGFEVLNKGPYLIDFARPACRSLLYETINIV